MRYDDETRRAVVAAYARGDRLLDIYTAHGVHPTTARRWVRDAGIPLRPQSGKGVRKGGPSMRRPECGAHYGVRLHKRHGERLCDLCAGFLADGQRERERQWRVA